MKKHITLLLSFITFFQYAQSPDYATTCVTYKVGWTKALDTAAMKGSSLNLKIKLIKAEASLRSIECKLHYNTTRSTFAMIEKLEFDKDQYYNRAKMGFDHKYYRDIVAKEKVEQTDFMGKYNIIVPFEKYKWAITSESKIISGYKCYKANGSYTLKSKENNDIPSVVEAWFAPEIAVQFGPNGFDGLPGLILEVVSRGSYLQAVKIELAIENQKIKLERPDQGVYVSEKEYNLMLFDLYQKRKSPSKE